MAPAAPDNEYRIIIENGKTITEYVSDKGGDKTDYVTVVNYDRVPLADAVYSYETPVSIEYTSGPGRNPVDDPTPGSRECHGKDFLEFDALSLIFSGGTANAGASLGAKVAKKYTISSVKSALKKVYEKLGTDKPLGKMEDGKWGSPQRGDKKKGYRLGKEGHPNSTNPNENGPHINWWDYTKGKYNDGKGPGKKGAEKIEN